MKRTLIRFRSAGVTFFEMVTLKRPFNSIYKDVRRSILVDPVPFDLFQENTPKLFKLLINKY